MLDPFNLFALAMLAIIGVVLLIRISKNIAKRRNDVKKDVASQTHAYDPKAGLLIVSTDKNPPVLIPGNLTDGNRKIVDDYLRLGKDLGLAISYFPHGASLAEVFMDEFIVAEGRYVELGFRPISLHAFEGLGGWNKPLPESEQPCVLRSAGEQAKLVGQPTKDRLKLCGRLY
mgnify:FL=1